MSRRAFIPKRWNPWGASTPIGPTPPRRRTVEVRREAVRGSGEKAARLDLESGQPLGEHTHFQVGLQAAQSEAAHNRLEQAEGETTEVDEELAGIEREREWRTHDAGEVRKALKAAKKKLERIPPQQLGAISDVAYLAVMVLFSGAEYPLLRLSFVRLPVDDTTIKMIALLTGATLVAGTHVIALATSRLVLHEGDRIEGRRNWSTHRAVVALGAVFYALVVAGLAWVRVGEIDAIDRKFNGQGMSHPVWLGIALGFLHAATLLAAFYVAYARARAAEWRAAKQLVEQREGELKEAEQALEELDRREARLFVRREGIADRADRDLEQLHRHHKLEEAKYLAILARSQERPPKPIADWDDSRTPRTQRTPPRRSLERPVATNGKADATSEQIRHAVTNSRPRRRGAR
jgi:predicted anti-sigma-YlaC factor YlaD